jgi:tRNA pseudouridine55 synthase
MHGFLNIHKPAGMTSRTALDFVKRVCWPSKTGHTGTLDPIAEGVLVVCIGDTTRLADYCQQMHKRYRATFLLDCFSETLDGEEGFQQLEQRCLHVSQADIAQALQEFVGAIQQVPPKYSAAKVKGRRAYKLVRQGQEFELKARTVTIYEIEIVHFAYPRLELDICCGSGTYIRSLGRDLAQRFQTHAVMIALTRTEVGPFHLATALDCRSLDLATVQQHLAPPATAVDHLPRYRLTDEEIHQFSFGRTVAVSGNFPELSGLPAGTPIAGLNPQGNLVSLLTYDPQKSTIRPLRNFRFE